MAKLTDRIKKALGLLAKDDPALQAEIDKALAEGEGGDDTSVTKELSALRERLEKAETEVAFAKMSDDENAFCAGMDEPGRKAFAALTPEQRAAKMKTKKSEGTVDEAVVKNLIDEAVAKALAPLEKANKDLETANKTLSDTVSKMTGEAETAALTEIAKAAGAPDPAGLAVLLKGLDASGREAMLTQVRALKAQVDTSALFGKTGIAPVAKAGSALDLVNTKVAELRKSDPKLSEAQAVARIVKSDPKLYEQYLAELN